MVVEYDIIGFWSELKHSIIEKYAREYSKILTTAFKFRSDSDYKDFYIITRKDAEIQLENAKKFIKRIQKFLK